MWSGESGTIITGPGLFAELIGSEDVLNVCLPLYAARAVGQDLCLSFTSESPVSDTYIPATE